MFFRKKQEEEVLKPRKKEPENDYEWDKKRIAVTFLFLAIAVLVGVELKKMFLPNTSILGAAVQNKSIDVQKPNVKAPNINFSSDVGSTVSEIKKNIENLNAAEVATSSPQVQKVLKDIQGIKDLPTNQAREMCFKLCSGI